jgi:hypothetical protein
MGTLSGSRAGDLYLRKISGTGGAAMLGLMRNPV